MRHTLALLLVCSCAGRAKQSVALYEAGDYAGAARAAERGLAEHPGDDALWGMRVRSALALGDADGVAKAYASYVAERGGDDRGLLQDLAIATIAQALASPSARLEITAIQTVEQLELAPLADDVARKLSAEDDRVAAAAAVAVLHGYPQAPQVADDMLHSENAEARRIAVDGVGKKIGKLAVADLEKAASDSDPRVRRVALHWLGVAKDADAVELCAKRMKDPDAGVRAEAASALARIGSGNLAEFAKQALAKDAPLELQLAGVELLVAAKRDDELVALVESAARPAVAIEAAIAVKATRPALAKAALERAMADEEWTTRAAAANALVRAVGKPDAVAYGKRMIGDRELAVRLAAARALAHAGAADDAKPVFAAALAGGDDAVQAAADLAGLGDASGDKALEAFVRDAARTPEQRAAAAEAHREAHHVTAGLVAALADSNGLVRIAAASAIGHIARGKHD